MGYKFISLKKFGGPEVLEVQTAEKLPEPSKNEVRVKVLVTSAAFTDTLIRKGIYPDVKNKPPITLGYDMLGIVDKLGDEVQGLEVGQKVAELTIIGAYSEYIIINASQLILVPQEIEAPEAVSLILSYMTAYQMLTRSANLQSGQVILIHGAGGAVGSALLQIGSILNLKMYGTASKSQHGFLREFGCHPIDYKSEDFVEVVNQLEKGGLDAVFDPMGGDNFKRSMNTLNTKGSLVAYGSYNADSKVELIKDFLRVKIWNILPWKPSTTFYSIGALHKKHHDWFREDLTKLFELLLEGKIKPTIAKKMNLEEASKAHELIEKGGVKGKIVLLVNEK